MLKIQAILIAGLFAFLLIKPAIPYLDYMVRKSYIIEKFCINKDKPEMACNGKCHLTENVKNNESPAESDRIPVNQKTWKIPEFLVSSLQEHLVFQDQITMHTSIIYYYDYQFSDSVFHPPV